MEKLGTLRSLEEIKTIQDKLREDCRSLQQQITEKKEQVGASDEITGLENNLADSLIVLRRLTEFVKSSTKQGQANNVATTKDDML